MSQYLRARIDELEEENRQLREKLIPKIQWPFALKLGRQQITVLSYLYTKSPKAVTRTELYTTVWPIESDALITVVSVVIWQLRKKLQPFGIDIGRSNYTGYWIDGQTAAILREWLDRGPDYIPPQVQP